MKLIERKDIDVEKWNERISRDPIQNIFSYTWYLDAVAENWCALISDSDYTTILPIAYTKKVGIERMYQAPFTREYHIFGNEFDWTQAIHFLTSRFKGFDFRIEDGQLFPKAEERKHQSILLNEESEDRFRTNCRRLIKKSTKLFKISEHNDPKILLDLFKTHVAHKIESINEQDLLTLNKLMVAALNNSQGRLLVMKDYKNEIVASGFFLIDKNQITYLKGAASHEAKKNGAMYGVINHIISEYIETHNILDFGGSDVESISTFFKKFGATDRNYYHYTIDNTPFWFKILKKLKTN